MLRIKENNVIIYYEEKEKERIRKMNRIYNNLSIENLIRTEWFNQFNKKQQEEIKIDFKK